MVIKMKRIICLNFALAHGKCGLLFIQRGLIINKKDLIPKCDGYKSPSECAWYKADYASFYKECKL